MICLIKYRGAIIMKNFKIIYFYNEEKDILWLAGSLGYAPRSS